MYVAVASLPFVGIVWASLADTMHANLSGLLWVAAVANSMIAISTRVAELQREVRGVKGGWSRSLLSASLSASSATVCLLSAVAGIVWTAGASLVTPHVSTDLTVPLACLLLLCTRRNLLVADVHPLALAASAASVWWYLSTLYAILGRGFAARNGIHGFELNGTTHTNHTELSRNLPTFPLTYSLTLPTLSVQWASSDKRTCPSGPTTDSSPPFST